MWSVAVWLVNFFGYFWPLSNSSSETFIKVLAVNGGLRRLSKRGCKVVAWAPRELSLMELPGLFLVASPAATAVLLVFLHIQHSTMSLFQYLSACTMLRCKWLSLGQKWSKKHLVTALSNGCWDVLILSGFKIIICSSFFSLFWIRVKRPENPGAPALWSVVKIFNEQRSLKGTDLHARRMRSKWLTVKSVQSGRVIKWAEGTSMWWNSCFTVWEPWRTERVCDWIVIEEWVNRWVNKYSVNKIFETYPSGKLQQWRYWGGAVTLLNRQVLATFGFQRAGNIPIEVLGAATKMHFC